MAIIRTSLILFFVLLLTGCGFNLNQFDSTPIKQSFCLLQSTTFDESQIENCQFQPYTNQQINFNDQFDLAVFKVKEIGDLSSDKEKVFVVDFKYFWEVAYIAQDEKGRILSNEKQFRTKASDSRIFSSEHYVFNFNPLAKNHYFAVKNRLKVAAMIKLVNKDDYIVFDQALILFFTVLYTSMVGLFLANFVFYLYIKQKSYLYYSFFILSALNTLFWLEGRNVDFGIFPIGEYIDQFNQFFFLISNGLLYIFLYHFLKLNNNKTPEARIVYWLIIHVLIQIILLFIFVLFSLSPGWNFISSWNNFTVQLSNLIILLIAWRVYRKGNRQAGFLLISWTLFIGFSSLRLFFVLYPAPNQFWMQHGHEIGVLIDAFVLAIALADQSLMYKKSGEVSQIKYLKASRALLGETLINNFLHQIKEEIMPKENIKDFASQIENHFAQMIVKYTPMLSVQRIGVTKEKFISNIIYEANADSTLSEYVQANKESLRLNCNNQNLFDKIVNINRSSYQLIYIPLLKFYQNKGFENEGLLIQMQENHVLVKEEINDLVMFVESALQALVDSKQLQDINEHAKNVITVAQEKENAMKLKDRFFANVSHEFRTPLSLTIAPLQDLNKQKEFLNTSGQYLVETALTNAQDLLGLVDNVLDIQKLESHIFPLQVSKVNVNQLIYSEIKRLKNWALDKNQNLRFEKKREESFIYCDSKEIRKIISNLISNAIKYSGNDSNIVLTIETEETWIKILITDDGRGIKKEYQQNIFDRYYQGQTLQHTLESGSGIGLSVVKDIMELHQGYVTLESEIGHGSEFTLWFKKGFDHYEYDDLIAAKDKDKFKQNNTKTEGNPVSLNNKTTTKDKAVVLIVEDNKELRKYLKFKLVDKFTIIQANNGEDGLEKAQAHLPDLIVSDVMMPKMDGIDMVNIIRQNKMLDTIPIIMLTAKAQKEDTIVGLKNGADDYMAKPFEIDELMARVERLIQSRKVIREHIKHSPELNEVDKKSGFQEKLDNMIMENLANSDLNVDLLSEKLFINRSTLYRKIKKEFQLTPVAYIRKVRMSCAMDLLQNKKLTVSETAYACGFESLSYFSKQFKKTHGKSPSDVL